MGTFTKAKSNLGWKNKMKYKIVTRDCDENYTRLETQEVKGWCLFGAEDEIDTKSDCFAMVFSEKKVFSPELTPQRIWDINNQLDKEDEVDGYTFVDDEYNTIEKCKNKA